MRGKQKANPLRRVVATFQDGSAIAFEINKGAPWELSIQRDIVSFDGGSGYVEHKGLASGDLSLKAAYKTSVWTAESKPLKARAKPRKVSSGE